MKNKFEKLCFGLGDFATNGMYTFIGTYILFFYTDIEKLDLSVVSMILLIGRTMDAVASVLAGILVDKTQTKWGKCRPYILLFSVPVCLFAFLQL